MSDCPNPKVPNLPCDKHATRSTPPQHQQYWCPFCMDFWFPQPRKKFAPLPAQKGVV